MADQRDDEIELDYGYLTQKALREVIRDVLEITANLGRCPGEHHFYIEFDTTHKGVSIAKFLEDEFPERMTIVLQHKFQSLTVEEDFFSVVLHFKGAPETLVVPFDAITGFHDPSTDYQLRFELVDVAANEAFDEETDENEQDHEDDESKTSVAPKEDGESADVVSLDAFRKK